MASAVIAVAAGVSVAIFDRAADWGLSRVWASEAASERAGEDGQRPGKPPVSWFPSAPSPRDKLVLLLTVDTSCDETNLPDPVLEALVYATVTHSAWREGTFGLAPVRNNALRLLNFMYAEFISDKTSDEAVRRDLRHQRDDAPIAELVRHIRNGRRGPCRTDLLEMFKQVQRTLSSRGVGNRPVTVVAVGNGLITASPSQPQTNSSPS